MTRFLLLLFILSNAFLGVSMATINQSQITEQYVLSQPPSNSNSPTHHQIGMRKLGKHQHNMQVIIGFSSSTPSPSPSESPEIEKKQKKKKNNKNKKMESSSISEGSSSSVPNHERNSVEEQPHYDDDGVLGYKGEEEGEEHMLKNMKQHHHHALDKSVAGGGVILGGLATTFLVSVFCYIKATGRQKPDITS
ncbi:hypothetical protein HN51_022625 [Arachis hypogaea]|nr:uncharacterized protein DS421_2g52190 [Arachis hypogaea]